ncbi:hypothetical protein O181_102011 [Austropuccinia psidii MF-1]|uniref:Uncharacterized protein n=1 Tax=Austropuccinia psidii MF-1 TaxID=1389203 RepID=A0A9Q3PJ71_9BASI|nr:hypothetical protein [Austropuccinia psidii MF-1]
MQKVPPSKLASMHSEIPHALSARKAIHQILRKTKTAFDDRSSCSLAEKIRLVQGPIKITSSNLSKWSPLDLGYFSGATPPLSRIAVSDAEPTATDAPAA